MSGEEEKYGSLLFFRKTGEPGTSYPLVIGKTCIGSSADADIRLKLKDERLEEIHCIIDVTETGIATIINKSIEAPIHLNTVSVRTFKVLHNEDDIDLIGKKFKYLNDNISEEDIGKHQASLNKAIGTPSQKRQSVAPVLNLQSTKKTPNFKTKTPVQRRPLSRKSFNRNSESIPENTPNKNQILERPKTTSKLIVSKALGSPRRAKKRRLTLDDNLKKQEQNLKVSERNILLSDNIVSSTMSEEEESVFSGSQLKADNEPADFLDLRNRSLLTSEDGSTEPISIRRSSMRTPSRSSIRITVTEPTPGQTPKSKITKALTPAKTGTPKTTTPGYDKSNLTESKVKTPKNIPLVNKRLELLKGTPNSTKKSICSPKTIRSTGKTTKRSDYITNLEETPPLSSKKRLTENIRTPSSSKVQISDAIKARQKSFGCIPPANKSMSTRRKTEGSHPTGNVLDQHNAEKIPKKYSVSSGGRKSNITSVDSADLSEGMEILNISDSSVSPIPPRTNLSSAESDPFEEQISKDPRLSLGKASPRKSVRKNRHTDQYSRRSLGIKGGDEENASENSEFVGEDTARTELKNSSFVRKSNMLKAQEGEDLKVADSVISSFRTPATRQSFRKSNLKEGSESESSSEESALPNLRDESLTSPSSSMSDTDVFELPSANESRWSSHRSDLTKKDQELSDVKPLFVPQRRRPLRSYVDESKELSVRLSRSITTQGEQNQRHSLESNAKKENEENSLNQSTLSNVSTRISPRKSTGKYCKSCEISPIKSHTPRRSSVRDSTISIFDQSTSSESDSISPTNETEQYTPKPKTSLSINESQTEEEISDVESLNESINSKSLSTAKGNKFVNSSVIMVDDDSIKGTPENNTSIVILDTPLEKPHRNSYKKLSKTLNSSIEDCVELTTPKSAIKSRRSKSLPYKPIVEEITPVTPQEVSRKESGFKTPLNTPGLFENIKNSVLKSRTRRRPSSNLMEELNKAEVSKATKRPRESVGSVDRLPKKRKMLAGSTMDSTVDEDFDASFGSFGTDEIFTDDNIDQYVVPNTPHDFRNLTDKPLITDPQAKSLTEPRKQRLAPNRRSLHAMRLESQFSESDNSSHSRLSNDSDISDSFTDTSVGSRRSRRLSLKAQKESPPSKVKKTPKSPENDLTDVRGVRRLLQTPKPVRSPKNDLSNIIGVKKLLSTPNIAKSPKNDLTRIPNLRKLVYPVRQNSPKNDLSNIAGVKKLLGTPKKVKTPRNDLRNIPNLRRIMSPKQQNSPRNDLSDVAGLKKLLSTPKKQKDPKNDLTNVTGVKKLMSTPKQQNSPLNDLTEVPNLRKIMYPKQQNSPRNDLSDVGGVADIFTETELYNSESDIENNEDLFGKLFVKKPIRTYRGKSLSPITRKAMLFGQDHNKTLGDSPVSSPRIEKWLEDQAVIKQSKVDDEKKPNSKLLKEENNSVKATPQRIKAVDVEETENQVEKKSKGRSKALHIETVENPVVESSRSVRRLKNTVTESPMTNITDSTTSKLNSPALAKRSRVRKVSQREEMEDHVEKKTRGRPEALHTDTVDQVIESPRSLETRQRDIGTKSPMTDIESTVTSKLKSPAPTKGSRVRKVSQREEMEDHVEKKPRGRPKASHTDTVYQVVESPRSLGTRQTDIGTKSPTTDIIESTSKLKSPALRKRGRVRRVFQKEETEDQVEEKSRGRPKLLHIERVENSVVEFPRNLESNHRDIRTESPITDIVESSSTSKLKSPAPTRRGRGRKVSQREETEGQVEEKPKRRPKTLHIETENPVVESPRSMRSRRRNVATESLMADIIDSTSTASKIESPAPTKRGRGRKVSKKEDMTQQVPEINSTTQDAKYEVTTTDTEVTPSVKRRGRPRTVSHDKATLEQKSNSRRKVPNKNDENNSDNEAVPNPISEDIPEATRRIRRRQVVIEDDELPEENIKNSQGNRRKVPKRNEDNGDSETMSNPTSEEMPEPSRRPRRKQIVIEDDDQLPEKENNKNIQGNRRRKVQKKNENNPDSEATSNPTSGEMPKPARRQQRKQVVIEDDDEFSEEENKNLRGNRRRKVPKKNEDNPISEEIPELGRKIQRRQVVIEDDDEVSEEENKENMQANAPKRKVAKRKNQKSHPVLEEVDGRKENAGEEIGHGKTSKKQQAKLQVEKLEDVTEETPEKSRRTRQRKGTFKKYGSQFVTDMKKMSFEEDKTDGKKKRKSKGDEQAEVENPIRRSKRTRK